jgi:hypothetical protein
MWQPGIQYSLMNEQMQGVFPLPCLSPRGGRSPSCSPTAEPYYFLTKEETVVQVHGIGPWGITFVNPADDLRQRTGQR